MKTFDSGLEYRLAKNELVWEPGNRIEDTDM